MVGGEQGAQHPVVHLGVEDRESEAVWVEAVGVSARDAGDEPVCPEAGQVVAGLVHGVVHTAEQSGHQGSQALVADAGDGEGGGAQGAGQGLDPRVAEPQSRGPPAVLGEGGACDPLKGWTRKGATLADTFSIEQAR